MFALLVACADPGSDSADVAADPPLADPDGPGPYRAATYETAFEGSTGVTLPVQVWYPTEDAQGTPADYDDIYTGTAFDGGTPACDHPRPVMVFSHGSGGMRWQSLFLTEHLATHGWVVVAPDHIGNTVFDDGTVPLTELIERRPHDVVDSFDWLLGEERVARCVDGVGEYVVAGHSFGGFTSIAVSGAVIDLDASLAWCAQHGDWLCGEVEQLAAAHPGEPVLDLSDPRAVAAVPMAPAGYEVLVGGLPGNSAPALFLGGTRDTLTPVESQVRPLWDGMGGAPRWLGVIEDAGHYTFSDACEFLPVFEDCDPPYLDPAIAHPLIATSVTAFVQSLDGTDRSAWLPLEDERLVWEEGTE